MTATRMSLTGSLIVLAAVAGAPELVRESPSRFQVQVIVTGLATPWSLAFAPDGRLFVAERAGRIRLVEGGRLRPGEWATLPVLDGTAQNHETGLMGLTLHPGFATEPLVYACYTYLDERGGMKNRIVRLRERDGRGIEATTLLDGIPGAPYHNGCRLRIGPDRKLYVTTGDAQIDSLAQDRGSVAGKILRLNLDGTIPWDNPFAGSPVWSLGHRNGQSLAWEPGTGRLFAPEHGTGGIDEVNLIEKGANYGWPVARGQAGDARFTDPVLVFVAAPAGATFLSAARYPGVSPGTLAVTSLSGQRMLLLRPEAGGATVIEDSALSGFGRLRDVVEGPDGYLYVATSNRDGRGKPGPDDDRILRLLPAGEN
jgi:aldose sugar dehydrogenase